MFGTLFHLQLLLQELSSFWTVAAVAVDVDGAGRGGVVDEQDRRHNVLVWARTLHRACDCVVRDEVLHVLLQEWGLSFWSRSDNKMTYSIVFVSSLARNILDDLQTLVAQLESHLVEENFTIW